MVSLDSETDSEATSRNEYPERRGFLGQLSLGVMLSGLVAGYGAFAAHIVRFLFPTGRGTKAWQFVATLNSLSLGESFSFETPTGAKLVIARQREGDSAEDFIALSSVCPHLGCAVHWESQHNRFFCPCHNGAFDASGKATEGPPAVAKQELSRYPLKVEKGLLYIQVPTESVVREEEA
jgi:Rieske Fe-S protein